MRARCPSRWPALRAHQSAPGGKEDKFSFGPRDNAIIQIAYTVVDIERACADMASFWVSVRGF